MLNRSIKYVIVLSLFSISCIFISGYYKEDDGVDAKSSISQSYSHNVVELESGIKLTIPKISFERNLYPLGDSRNEIDKNIIFVDASSMPDEEKGNVIIAGHNGTSRVSFFRNLHKLEVGDTFSILYDDIKYNYRITKVYLVDKTGMVEIRRDRTKSTATLVTCYGKKQQLVLIGVLE